MIPCAVLAIFIHESIKGCATSVYVIQRRQKEWFVVVRSKLLLILVSFETCFVKSYVKNNVIRHYVYFLVGSLKFYRFMVMPYQLAKISFAYQHNRNTWILVTSTGLDNMLVLIVNFPAGYLSARLSEHIKTSLSPEMMVSILPHIPSRSISIGIYLPQTTRKQIYCLTHDHKCRQAATTEGQRI